MISNKKITDFEPNMGAFMRRISTIVLVIFLLLPAAGLQILQAEGFSTAGKDSLIIKQYSLDEKPDHTASGESQLTFRFLVDSGSGIDAGQWLTWLEEGAVIVEGVRLKLHEAVVRNGRQLRVPFEIEQPLRREYLATIIRTSGNSRYATSEAELSLYSGVNSVVEITSSGSRFRTNRQAVVPENFQFEGSHSRPDLLAYVVLPSGEEIHQPESSFLFRNRYWFVGATALAVSGTSALILNSGDSVTYLPEPPGRP